MTNPKTRAGKKATAILRAVLLLMLTVQAITVSAQQIILQSKSQTRQQTVSDIEAQTGCQVFFENSLFKSQTIVNFGRTQLPLSAVLDKLAENTGLTHTTDGQDIVFHRRNETPGVSALTVVSAHALTGTVLDADGNPIEGAKVELVERGDNSGKSATTFANGRFQIENVPTGNHLVKITTPEETVRFREVTVAAGADVSLTVSGEILKSAEQANMASKATTKAVKTTAYFVPNTTGHTIRAFTDEPKTEYGFVPYDQMRTEEYLPKFAVKTNLLYLATTTLDAGVEFGLARKWTLGLSGAYNPFQLQEGGINLMWLVQPELRYWFCQRFEKHFIGLHGLYGQFNIGQVDFLTTTFEQNRYSGWGAGAGISYGYHLPIANRWALEFTLGAGYVYLEYDKFRCYECDEFVAKKNSHYFGPTKAGVSLIFMIK